MEETNYTTFQIQDTPFGSGDQPRAVLAPATTHEAKIVPTGKIPTLLQLDFTGLKSPHSQP